MAERKVWREHRWDSTGVLALLVTVLAAVFVLSRSDRGRTRSGAEHVAPSQVVPLAAANPGQPPPATPNTVHGSIGVDRSPTSVELDEEVGAKTKSIDVRGFALLPDGAPAAGEFVDVRLVIGALPYIVTDRYEVAWDGSFGGSLALPTDAPGGSPSLFYGDVRSEHGYARAGIDGRTVDKLIERGYSLELRLRRVALLSGQVLSPSGRPQRGAALCLYHAREYEDRRASRVGSHYSRPDGRFDIPVEEPGEYVLMAKVYGVGGQCRSIEIGAVDKYIDIGTIVVEGDAQLSGCVIAAHGAVLPRLGVAAAVFDSGDDSLDYSVRLYDRRLPLGRCAGLPFSQARTDADGAFVMPGMAEGSFRIFQREDNRLGQPSRVFSTGREHVVQLPTFPFEVLVQDYRGMGIAALEVSVVGLDSTGTPRDEYLKGLRTDAEGIVLVPWASPGQVLVSVDDGHGKQMETHYVVPAAGCVRVPRCVITRDAAPGHGAMSLFVESDSTIPLPVYFSIKRRDHGTTLVREAMTGEDPIHVSGLAAGVYEVTAMTHVGAGLHFVLPDESLGQVVDLGEGALQYMRFVVRIGGRFRVRLNGDRMKFGTDRWTVHRIEPDGRSVRLWLYQAVKDGASRNNEIQLEEWWTAEPVLEQGPYDLQVRRNGVPFASTRILIQPGTVADWELRVTD